MKIGERPDLLEHCSALLRHMREAVMRLAGQMIVVRYPYERRVPIRLPDSVQSVLFVCKGNICRSPLAAVYFQSLVGKQARQMAVRSAGLETTPGKPAHANAKAVALAHRLSLDEHATTQVQVELLDQSDLIIVMEIVQKDRINRLYPRSKGKVMLLGRFDSGGALEIADPYSGTSEDFRSCFQQVSRCCDVLAARLGLQAGASATGSVLPATPENS